MQNQDQQYAPGDIANGHVLTESGQWLPVGGPPAPAGPGPKAKKPIYKRWWAIAIAAVFVIGGIASATGGGDEPTKPASDASSDAGKPSASTPAKDEPKAEEPEVEPVEEAPALTSGQENALRAAENYLDVMPYSYKGLIQQLSSEYGDGYSKKDATFAADHVDANWNEQAAKAAKNYLDIMPYSRAGLIEQLSSAYGDQYTVKQATNGVDKAGL